MPIQLLLAGGSPVARAAVGRKSLHQDLEAQTPHLRTSERRWSHMRGKAPVKTWRQNPQRSRAQPEHSMVRLEAALGNGASAPADQLLRAHAGQIRNAPKKKTKMVIKFYPNHVFTVDDGPPRSTADAANQRFLQAVKEQRIPDELVQQHPNGLDLSIMPMPEDYDEASAPRYLLPHTSWPPSTPAAPC